MPNTPIYNLPYPALTDPPNGPDGFQKLATSTDTSLDTINQALVALLGAPGVKIKYGKITATSDSSGNYTFSHGLGVVPKAVIVSAYYSNMAWFPLLYNPGITATLIHVVCRDHANAVLANTTNTIGWIAIG